MLPGEFTGLHAVDLQQLVERFARTRLHLKVLEVGSEILLGLINLGTQVEGSKQRIELLKGEVLVLRKQRKAVDLVENGQRALYRLVG